jgi:hypothetical protein
MAEDYHPEVNIDSAENTTNEKTARRALIAAVIVGVLLLAGLITGVIFLAGNPTKTETIRDIFIILLALEFFVIGAAIVVLIVQIARLTALLENEIKPILASTNETVNTLRGTSEFLSNQLVQPVVKTYSSLSAFRRIFDIFRPTGHQRKE